MTYISAIPIRDIIIPIVVGIALRVCVFFRLESQRVLNTVKVDVDHGCTVRLDRELSLIVGGVLETFIGAEGLSSAVALGDGDTTVVDAHRRGGDVGGGILDEDGFLKVIDLLVVLVDTLDALFPNDNGIVRLGVSDPAGVQSRTFRQRMTEFKLTLITSAVGMFLRVEPAAEFITVADHLIVGDWLGRVLSRFDESGGTVGSTIEQFLKDQPHTLRGVYTEGHVALDVDNGIIREGLVSTGIFLDIATAVVDAPALEIMGGVALSGHADLVLLILARIVEAEQNLMGTTEDIRIRLLVLAHILNMINLEDQCVVGDLRVGSQTVGTGFDVRPHLGNSHGVLKVSHGINIVSIASHPSAEYFSIRQRDFVAGVANDVHQLRRSVRVLDI